MEDIKDDPRFAHILSDPKFLVMPKSKKKVKIDSRFSSVFSSQHFSHKTDIDKRGRPIFDITKRNRHVMKRFYELSDDDNDDDDNDDDVKSESDQEATQKQTHEKKRKNKRSKVAESADDVNIQSLSETESKQQKHIPEENKKPIEKNSRKIKQVAGGKHKIISKKSSSSEKDFKSVGQLDLEDSSGSTTDNDDNDEEDDELPEFSQEFALEETDIDHKWNELHTDAVAVVESTCRLAVCNMDWDFVRAQDLFVLFKSFVPDGGRVKSVTIYPSEFGKERMAEEAMLGPREMRAQKEQECGKAVREGQSGQKKNRTTNQQQMKKAMKDLEATQTEKLREYQLNRLRYYFAVVDCDSVVTAENIYNECDGREYLLSSVRLDLRFIPENMTFDDPPREVFSQEQSILEYKPSQFSSTALCQAKVDVTWDETEFDRLSRRIGGMPQKELESIVEDNKYADIIAPPESDSDQDADDQPDWLKQAIDSNADKELNEEGKIAMYRQLLMEKLDSEEGGDDGDEEGKGEEKELVWTPGLKSSLVKRMEKKERKQENTSVVSDYLEKKREKKKKKKEDKVKKKKGNEQADIDDNNMNGNVEVSYSTQTKRKKKKQKMNKTEETAEAKNTADLALLVLDNDDAVKDTYAETDKPSKKKGKKLKAKKKKLALAEVKDEFQLDMSDPRFGALYTSQHFHIDPSSSQFKKSTNMAALMNEQIKRRGHSGKPETQSRPGHNGEHSRSLSQALVDSIKSKMRK